MRTSLPKFLSLAKAQAFGHCRLYGEGGRLIAMFPQGLDDNNIRLMDELTKFYTEFPGTYQLICKRVRKNTKDMECSFTVYGPKDDFTAQSPALSGTHAIYPAPVIDIEAEREKIRKELMVEERRKEKERLLQEQLQAVKDENRDLKTSAGKLSFVGEQLMVSFLQKQGMTPAGQQPKQHILNGTPHTITKEDAPVIKEAIEIFMRHVKPEFLLSLAKKVDENPNLVSAVRSFLNIKD